MEITYFGHASFLLKFGKTKIITDPYSDSIGIKFPSCEADIVTISHNHEDHNNYKNIKGNPLVITLPGEYEKNDIRITGYLTNHDNKQGQERGKNVIYRIEAKGMSVLHCGDLGEMLSAEILEEIGDINILLIPIGGIYTIGVEEAVKLMSKVEPAIVIPMHYYHTALNQTFAKLANYQDFLHAMGQSDIEPVAKLNVEAEEIIEGTKVVVMKPQNDK